MISPRSAIVDGQPRPQRLPSPPPAASTVHSTLSRAYAGCGGACIQGACVDAAEASRAYIFLAPSLAWLPVLVALDHPGDDHQHAVCAVAGSDVSPLRVPRQIILRHDGQALKLQEGAHAQMLLSDALGYACQVWAKVVIKKVWAEGYAVVTICSQLTDVVAYKVRAASFLARHMFSHSTFTCAGLPPQRLHAAHAP